MIIRFKESTSEIYIKNEMTLRKEGVSCGLHPLLCGRFMQYVLSCQLYGQLRCDALARLHRG